MEVESASPSSRRAWIEINNISILHRLILVALLAEGVDRNNLSATWSESSCVALLAEGVDRNVLSPYSPAMKYCRPPRGGRG